MFETFIVQPIFNLLLFLYTILGDFGIAVIVFTVAIRFLMWPLLRKQLHQSKVMREMQPEIKKIRSKHKGNRQAESMALMELYKEKGVNPVGSLGLLLIQLPVFFGLFSALRSFISDPQRLIRLPYEFLRDNADVQGMLGSVADKTTSAIQGIGDSAVVERALSFVGELPASVERLSTLGATELNTLYTETLTAVNESGASEQLVQGPFFEQQLFGIIDLSGRAVTDGAIYWPVMIIALLAGVFQYFQTKQLTPKTEGGKSVREIMKEAARTGKEPDQSEVSAAVGRRMSLFFAPLIVLISATAPAGLALYFATSGLVGMIQQRTVLRQDVDEMEDIADEAEKKSSKSKKKKSNSQKKGKKKGS